VTTAARAALDKYLPDFDFSALYFKPTKRFISSVMPVVDPSKLVKLQDAPEFVRNVSLAFLRVKKPELIVPSDMRACTRRKCLMY